MRFARLTPLPVHALQMNVEAVYLANACSCHDVSPQNTNQLNPSFLKLLHEYFIIAKQKEKDARVELTLSTLRGKNDLDMRVG